MKLALNNGVPNWEPQAGDSFIATGQTFNGHRRFPTHNLEVALAIGFLSRSIYLVRNGKRHLILRSKTPN